jgi:hypothetical protein
MVEKKCDRIEFVIKKYNHNKMQNQETLSKLTLLDEFVSALYSCAADPTEDKINEFYNSYNDRLGKILEATPLQTWGDTKIFSDGEMILNNIRNETPLDQVKEELKNAANRHFLRGLFECLRFSTEQKGAYAKKISDFYNDYNDKLEYIEKIIEIPSLPGGIKDIFDKISDYSKFCFEKGYAIRVESLGSEDRNKHKRKAFTVPQQILNIFPYVTTGLSVVAAENFKEDWVVPLAQKNFKEAKKYYLRLEGEYKRYNYADKDKDYITLQDILLYEERIEKLFNKIVGSQSSRSSIAELIMDLINKILEGLPSKAKKPEAVSSFQQMVNNQGKNPTSHQR